MSTAVVRLSPTFFTSFYRYRYDRMSCKLALIIFISSLLLYVFPLISPPTQNDKQFNSSSTKSNTGAGSNTLPTTDTSHGRVLPQTRVGVELGIAVNERHVPTIRRLTHLMSHTRTASMSSDATVADKPTSVDQIVMPKGDGPLGNVEAEPVELSAVASRQKSYQGPPSAYCNWFDYTMYGYGCYMWYTYEWSLCKYVEFPGLLAGLDSMITFFLTIT